MMFGETVDGPYRVGIVFAGGRVVGDICGVGIIHLENRAIIPE